MQLMLSSSGGCVIYVFNTPVVQHWPFSLKTEYATDLYWPGRLEPPGAIWIQAYADVTLRGVRGYIPALVPLFLQSLLHFDFHAHHVSWRRVAVPRLPWSGKQGDWDWKEHWRVRSPVSTTSCSLWLFTVRFLHADAASWSVYCCYNMFSKTRDIIYFLWFLTPASLQEEKVKAWYGNIQLFLLYKVQAKHLPLIMDVLKP